jgi:Na+-driven multidrug efflux pump
MGSWLLFFSFIENYGTHALAVSNAVRVLYLFLGVPTWGMGNATTTIISQLIGQGKKEEVFMTALKISAINFVLNAIVSSCILIAPVYILSITTTSPSVIIDAAELMPLLFGMLLVISVANIVYYAIVGTGAIGVSLIIQIITVTAYTIYAYWATELRHLSLSYAWCAEYVYFALCIALSITYLKSNRWRTVEL